MGEKILILDRGNVEFMYPDDWILSQDKEGFVALSDPNESCRIEISYMTLPAGAGEIPVEALLRKLLKSVPESGETPKVEAAGKPKRRFAWADYVYESVDKRNGMEKEARGRYLLGSNGIFQILATLYYWAEDADWVLPKWQRLVETIQFGDGSQLESPEEHWSRRRQH